MCLYLVWILFGSNFRMVVKLATFFVAEYVAIVCTVVEKGVVYPITEFQASDIFHRHTKSRRALSKFALI